MTWVEITRVRNDLSLFRLIVIPLKTSAASKLMGGTGMLFDRMVLCRVAAVKRLPVHQP